MINRRHIRVKVMQSVYAMIQANNTDIVKEEKFLRYSIDKMHDLYILSLDLLVRVNQLAKETAEISKKKYFATQEELNPNLKFINNRLIAKIANSTAFNHYLTENQLNNWYLDDSFVKHIYNQMIESKLYQKYMSDTEDSYKKDQKFVSKLFSELIAPDEKIDEYFEDQEISWADDIPHINTWVLKSIQDLKEPNDFVLGRLYKNEDDKNFVSELFKKVILNHHHFEGEIEDKTPNWEMERIAEVDMILIKMAICEFLKFPSIPVKVTINEYLEIAKDYSSEKSSFFINGVLDKLWREFDENNRLNKVGRGVL